MRERDVVEESWTLDLRALRRAGLLEAGARAAWGVATGATVQVETHVTEIVASYRARAADAVQVVEIVWVKCRFGGQRAWFRCPWCDRRAAVLYLPPDGRARRFACRTCHGLAYATQGLRPHRRLLARRDKLLRRLGAAPGADYVEKPRRMRWRTFDRVLELAGDAHRRAEAAALPAR